MAEVGGSNNSMDEHAKIVDTLRSQKVSENQILLLFGRFSTRSCRTLLSSCMGEIAELLIAPGTVDNI